MTSLTGREVIAAKRALSIMTGQTALATSGGVMIERLRLRNLTALRHARANLMTLVT